MWTPQSGIWLETVNSTNSWLKHQQAKIGDWVQAGSQTGGRGRVDHLWTSPRGNVYLSILIPRRQTLLAQSLAIGVAATDVCRHHGVSVHVKWPNDLCLQGKKLGGVLCEVVDEGVIAGIGLNLRQNGLPQEAIALEAYCQELDPRHWGRSLVESFVFWTDSQRPLQDIEQAWLKRWHGQERKWDWGQGLQSGKLVSLDLEKDQAQIFSNRKFKLVRASLLSEKWS